MSEDLTREVRLAAFAAQAVAAMSEERYKECELLAEVEPGMWLRPCARDPEWAELIWAGEVVGLAKWTWLNGIAPSSEATDR